MRYVGDSSWWKKCYKMQKQGTKKLQQDANKKAAQRENTICDVCRQSSGTIFKLHLKGGFIKYKCADCMDKADPNKNNNQAL